MMASAPQHPYVSTAMEGIHAQLSFEHLHLVSPELWLRTSAARDADPLFTLASNTRFCWLNVVN